MSVTAVAQNASLQADAAPAQPATPGFADVRAILDGLVRRWTEEQGIPPQLQVHGAMFHWETREQLLAAAAFDKRLIDPDKIGNGRARETMLVRVLSGEVDWIPRMPAGGPYATDEQIATIARWIDAGCPEVGTAATLAPAKQSNTDTAQVRQFARRFVQPETGARSGLQLAPPRIG